jgi:hypothetical protein
MLSAAEPRKLPIVLSPEEVEEVVISKEVVEGTAQPLYIYAVLPQRSSAS